MDLNAPAVRQHVDAIDADKRREADDIGVLQNNFYESLLAFPHGRKRNGCRRFRNTEKDSGILHGEKALGNDQEQKYRKRQRSGRDDQSGWLMLQHESQDRRILL